MRAFALAPKHSRTRCDRMPACPPTCMQARRCMHVCSHECSTWSVVEGRRNQLSKIVRTSRRHVCRQHLGLELIRHRHAHTRIPVATTRFLAVHLGAIRNSLQVERVQHICPGRENSVSSTCCTCSLQIRSARCTEVDWISLIHSILFLATYWRS